MKTISRKRQLLLLLTERGLLRAREAAQALGISQPTFSRTKAAIQEELVAFGKGRSTSYGARRNALTAGSEFPVFLFDKDGNIALAATITLIKPRGLVVLSHSTQFSTRSYEDLPYWLNDLRPAGFLGRLIPKQHPEFGYPPDIRLWRDEHCFHYWSMFGSDLVGNILIGERAYQLYHEERNNSSAVVSNQLKRYEQLAAQVLLFGQAGSSAAGEQPKFLTLNGTKRTPVLVKFSPEENDAVSRRIRDLLICEQLSLETLKESGAKAPNSKLLSSKKRTFLELERFDRTASGGRLGLMTLETLVLEYTGNYLDWRRCAKELHLKGLISQKMQNEIIWRYYFGLCILNSDMHLANLSFFSDGEQITGVAPIYDMLPTAFAPHHGSTEIKHFHNPVFFPEEESLWRSALKVGIEYWARVAKDRRLDSSVIAAAKRRLQGLKELLG